MAHGATEYAVVTRWPARSRAAVLVAQWQAQLTSAPLRPAPKVSNAPVLTSPASSRAADANSVVAADDEAVLESFGREVALLLGDPFLQPAVRHDLQRHPPPPWLGLGEYTNRCEPDLHPGQAAERPRQAPRGRGQQLPMSTRGPGDAVSGPDRRRRFPGPARREADRAVTDDDRREAQHGPDEQHGEAPAAPLPSK